MDIPRLDIRRKEDIVKKIEELSKVFTPEWNFDQAHPDAAAAVALIYADMMEATIEKYNRTAEKNLVEFHNCLGAEALYPYPARGYVCFNTEGYETDSTFEYLTSGTNLSTQGEKGRTITYVTKEPVCVWNKNVEEIFCEDTLKDQIFHLYSGDGQAEPENIPVYKSSDCNLQKHILYFDCRDCEEITDTTRGILEIEFDHENADAYAKFLETVRECGLYYSSQDGFVKCQNLKREKSGLVFSFDMESLPQKTQIQGVDSYWFRMEFESASMLEQLYIKEIKAATFSGDVRAESVFNDNEELPVIQFQPFAASPIPYSCVYFVCDRVLCHRGARIQMEFRVDYQYETIQDESLEQKIEWKNVMKKSKFEKPVEYDVSVQSVVWEYFNGSGWVCLFEDNAHSEVFNGKNAGATVHIEFECPDDMDRVFLPSGEKYSIRARISAVGNYMKSFGRYVIPVVSSLLFKYDYEKIPKAGYMATDNCMEQRLYAFDKNFHSVRAAYTRHANGKSLYFGFPDEPSKEGIHILFIKDKNQALDKRTYVWEYLTKGKWKALSCNDNTLGLSKTGVLLLHQNREFDKAELFGKECCWLRIRYPKEEDYVTGSIKRICMNVCQIENIEYQDEESFYVAKDEGLVCRLSMGNIYKAKVLVNEAGDVSIITAAQMIKDRQAEPVYDDAGGLAELWVEWKEENNEENNDENKDNPDGRIYQLNRESSEVIFGRSKGKIPPKTQGENVKIFYSTCSGGEGNFSAGHEFRLEAHSNIIMRVYNPMNLYGGADYENIKRTLTRSSENLRMHGRACTISDLEHMAVQAERSVIRVKVLSSRNGRGQKQYGALTMVVLLSDMDNFSKCSDKIRAYIEKKRCLSVRPENFEIIPPWRIYCNISLVIKISDTANESEVQKTIEDRLEEYFDPITGGADAAGWEIGSVPERAGINSVLLGVRGVEMVNHFYLSMLSEDGDEITDAMLGRWKETGMTIPVLKSVSAALQK